MAGGFRSHVTVNTGDMWAASDQNSFIKGNWDFINNRPAELEITPDTSFAMTTGSSPAGPTTYEFTGGGYDYAWRALRYSATADQWRGWSWIVEEGYGVSPVLELWGYMSAANTGTKAVRINVYLAASAAAENIYNKVFGSADTLDHTINNTASVVTKATITITNGESLVEDDIACLAIEREGTHANDDATGEWRLLGGRFIFNYAS